MSIYFIFEFFLFVLIVKTFNYPESIKSKILFYVFIIWALIVGLRGYTVGNDTYSYVSFFNGTNANGVGYGTVKFPGETIESGFVIISEFLSFFSTNGTFFLTISSLFVWFSIYLMYYKKENSLWCFLFFLVIGYNFVAINAAIRQSYSIGFILYGIYFIQKANFNGGWKSVVLDKYFLISILLVGFSLTVHRTSILLFPLLIIVYFIPLSKRVGYLLLLFSLVISQFFIDKIAELFDLVLMNIGTLSNDNIALLGDRYESSFGETSSSFIRNLSWTIPCMCTLYLVDKKTLKSFFFKCYIFATCCYLLFSSSFMVTRLNLIFLILGFSVSIPRFDKKNKNMYYLYILFTIYYLWRAFVGFEKWPITDSTLPYYFFWE